MSLTTTARLKLAATQSEVPDLGSRSRTATVEMALTLADGTGAGQADLMFADTRTLTASSSEDLDLAGVLTDAFGSALTFARIKALAIKAAAGNTNTVVFSRPAANGLATLFSAASDAVILRPGAMLILACSSADATGYAVTAGTGDLVTVTNGGAGTSVTYDVVIIGASA